MLASHKDHLFIVDSLFIVYTNDIADQLDCLTRLFADDTSLGVFAPDNYMIEINLNSNLSKLNTWGKQWLIKYNPDKTEAVLFSTKRNTDMIHLCFNNVNVKMVDAHKHLGITLSNNGKWTHHIDNILRTTSKMVNSKRSLK